MDIREDSGVCTSCKKGEHDICPMVMGGIKGGMAFCSCKCKTSPAGDSRSLGAPEKFDVPRKVSRELRKKFPRMEHDPLDNIL